MKLMILDGNSVVNRAYFGVPPLTNREGLHTNAIYGFLNILQRMESEERPDAVCVAFDLHGPTFRHLQYDGYKATRHGMPEELAEQMPVLKDVLRAMEIPIFECQGWEADDVIGTVGRLCAEQDWNCVIVTGDRDSLQLVTDKVNVKLVISKRGQTLATLYTPEVFREEYGFDPPQMVDLKGLMGDASDNLPGVKGVGQKTATTLLLQFGTMKGLYDHLDDPSIRPKLREKLENGRAEGEMSYDLATIRCNAPITFDPKECVCKGPNKPELYKLFMQLEFLKLIDRYGLRDVEEAQTEVEAVPVCTEFPAPGTPCAIGLTEDGKAAVAWEQGVCVGEINDGFRALLSGAGEKVCHDLKTLLHRLEARGLPTVQFSFDTALAAYDLDPTVNDYGIHRVAAAYLSQTVESPADEISAVYKLWPLLKEKLQKDGVEDLYNTIELPLCRVLYRMEQRGVVVNRQALEQFREDLGEKIELREREIYGYAGGPFNINSPKQLGQILFEQMGLPPVKKTKTGYSTNAEVLEKLRFQHPIVDAILDYRMLTKLKSTYADGLLKVIREDGRVHTTFQNMVTATGRLSSTDPNLQNIPVRTELGAEVRRMFTAPENWVLVDADYSQIELRVLAHIAKDPIMTEAFRSGADIHTTTACQVFGVSPEEVTPLQRRHAKAVNFGIVYGISEFSLADDIGVSRWEAKNYIDAYLNRYAGVHRYMEDIVESAKAQGSVRTLYGRRRDLPELKSSNFHIRQGAERIALNTPIQGTAADLMKLAMIRVDQALQQGGLQARMILQVHDEIIVECPPEEADRVQEIITREMEQAADFSVPLLAEAKQGKDWFQAK